MVKISKSDHQDAKHLNPDSVNFSMFTSEDVKMLSVLKISTPLSFDSLGFPLPGGLHDLAMGPVSDRGGDLCKTCMKNTIGCPGHFGHIELPLPVVNPMFHKIIATILRKSCLNCFRMQVPEHIKYVLSMQMQLLDKGQMAEAIEVYNRIVDLVSKFEKFENIPETELAALKPKDSLPGNEKDYLKWNNKNTESLRNDFISNIFTCIKSNIRCIHCMLPLDKIITLKNKLFISKKQIMDESSFSVKAVSSMKHVSPEESRKFMQSLWENERELLVQIIPVLKTVKCQFPTDVLYMHVIPVTPNNVRPVNIVNGRMTENPSTKLYKTILQDSVLLRTVIQVLKENEEVEVLPEEAQLAYTTIRGNNAIEKLNYAWESLQNSVNFLVDMDMKNSDIQGLKQLIEKKSGIIRKHMMGKRVNFAARSVITPDPNLNIDEIGIPEEFAKHLTYPVPVTSWNVEDMRKLILNGPYVHPGAVSVEYEDGTVSRINSAHPVTVQSILKRLLTPDGPNQGFQGVKLVNRHLCNGDVLLLNRQPTLHKPSIMAHKARVLKGEKTLRLHYANCKAYNADFDGDEMNAHFPQSELSRSEAYTIANVANQYLVPKDGTPLSGLIQDHMISGVKLSIRGKFFNKYDYQQLVYQAVCFKHSYIKLLPPTIIKPYPLWSGKQILSTVILNIIPKGKKPINLTATSKISANAWVSGSPRTWKAGGTPFENPNSMTEAEVVIRQGELLSGILDKSHYGATPYGLVHCVYELYGGDCSIKLLSSFAKLFTCFLQMEGFTLGVHDILVQAEADKKRDEIIKRSRKIGVEVMTTALNIAGNASPEEIVEKLEEQSASNQKMRAIVDRQYKSALDSYTNDINKCCIPAGLICKFPQNNLQLMVQSGAKGSTVNTMQISCLLGQIELEGKRPPLMISGKSLPSFPSKEFSPRAGGFIDGRFMTGIKPQEFFFHCMAGREGLIDTAVKTSRSGYLQRCLIKHLEGLTVGYDLTVRDSDKSVIQFAYGEDSMDISKVQYLNRKQLKFLADNHAAIIDKNVIQHLKSQDSGLNEHSSALQKWREEHADEIKLKCKTPSPFSLFSLKVSDKVKLEDSSKVNPKTGRSKKAKFICELWQQSSEDIRENFHKLCAHQPDPSVSMFQPDNHYGSLNERLADLITDFKKSDECPKKLKKHVEDIISFKAMQSLCHPGEPVGLLAAQSIGEPSTQMTLNTFHFAGRGEMNVTLGIPRLREILMMASKSIKTPSMEVPFRDVLKLEAKAEKLRKVLTRVVVADVLEKIDVEQELILTENRAQRITLKFHFMPYNLYKQDYNVRPHKILKFMSEKFFKVMFSSLQKSSKTKVNMMWVEDEKQEKKKVNDDEDEDNPEETKVKEKSKKNKSAGNEEESSDDEAPEDPEDAKGGNRYNELIDDQEPEAEDDENDLLVHEKDDDDDADGETDDDGAGPDLTNREIESIINTVIDSHEFAHDFTFDVENYQWCKLTFNLPIALKNIYLTTILRDAASKCVLWETPGIRRAIIYKNNDQLMLKTDGINLGEMFRYSHLLDLNKLYANDIHKIVETYGIEAGSKVIVREVRDVFKVYGITVDHRHLSLIADYMTYSGKFEPLNRKGMEDSSSPLHQLSFESSLTFLKTAATRGKTDKLENPSSCLMIGKPCNTGTGSFTLLQKLQTEVH